MAMIKNIKGFLVRSLAVATLVLTYILGNIAPHLLTVAGISALGVTATGSPAIARRRYRRRGFYGYWPYRRWRRVSPL